ncbi:MAG: insulinase family protein [Candidatus Wallbacteria bacterium]|nr:insulinase family protein [Candidatus Wallbacteria bacterium]
MNEKKCTPQIRKGSLFHGFRLQEKEKAAEINAEALLFSHEKSGARLLWLKNDDPNKVFAIAFRTPPADHTGLPHILEHSVLCGSRKFPGKEPFVELAKGSLCIFLNAFTFADKTMYPVASKNDKDFLKLVDVYLDSVLFPNIYRKPEILMQEGWHYELPSPDAAMTYKGVVYNEMKGSFSSPWSLVHRAVHQALFPVSPYRFVSGGDPDHIVDLSQEQFLDFHRKYYHPANSYIIIYGNCMPDQVFPLISGSFLDSFEHQVVDSEITNQPLIEGPREVEDDYPLAAGDNCNDKYFYSMSWVTGEATDAENYLACDMLRTMLVEMPGSPLKEALLKRGVGRDIRAHFYCELKQPVFSIHARNAGPGLKETFSQTVMETLEKLAQGGFDPGLAESVFNRKEFELREADDNGMPRGLTYAFQCMDSWLYDGPPLLHLRFKANMEKIRTQLNGGYFEKLIRRSLLDNKHRCRCVLIPRPGLLEKREQKLAEKLSGIRAGMSDQETAAVVENTLRLKELQKTPDSEEAQAAIPLLSLSDINTECPQFPLRQEPLHEGKILHHEQDTCGLVYVDLYFDLSWASQEKLAHLSLLSSLLGKVSTSSRKYSDLAKEINLHTGGIEFSSEVLPDCNCAENCFPKLIVKAKCVTGKLSELAALLREILVESRFDESDRILEIVRELKSRFESGMMQSGDYYVQRRIASYFSRYGIYQDRFSGISAYRSCVALERSFAGESAALSKSLADLTGSVFSRKNLLASVTCSATDFGPARKHLERLAEVLPDSVQGTSGVSINPVIANEGFMAPVQLQFAGKGYNIRKLGFKSSGRHQIFRTIVGMDYLWNRIRVQGGAYGAFVRMDLDGNVIFLSYRDPNLERTYQIYDELPDYLESFDVSDRELRKYIIGTIGRADGYLTPARIGETAARSFISGLNPEDRQREWQEILSSGVQDVRNLAGLVREILKKNCVCAIGAESVIRDSKGLFETKARLLE